MIEAIFDFNFMQNAFAAAVLASIACGLIGTIIVEKKLVMLSGGIAHTSFGGIGLGYLLNIEPIYGAFAFAVGASLAIASIRRKIGTGSDTLIGMFWSLGMALGVLFIGFTPGYPPDISSYLFGDILTVRRVDVWMMGALTVFMLLAIISLFNYWKAYLFDEEFLRVLGVKSTLLENFLFIMIALAIVILIRVVGIVLVIALLTAPPAAARLYTEDLKKIMGLAVVFGLIFSFSGLTFSYYYDLPSGAVIIITAALFYFGSVVVRGSNE
ncbi:metal ABC transporter permease [Halanaerobium sp. ST460_2HS_T2]|uniref:metal ABC transporter permease n=1 Tax=Halanaerobium sp. ST460_2HS_T2 TaxID=2183914 RepID=UPI000DF3D4FD|nr:metal ABC transporter permease [Halanaerobium sp. ST460_2HS_T2]RCW62358.1 zinc transport system permease protein [Halanaerobium sp. ST460_2HS_T2]